METTELGKRQAALIAESKKDLALFDSVTPSGSEIKIKFDPENITPEKTPGLDSIEKIVESAEKIKAAANPATAAKKIIVDDIFSDIKKKTEHDPKEKSKIESLAESFTETDFPDVVENSDDDPIQVKKANAQASANGWVEVFDIIFMVICMWASGDWTATNAQAKYSLHPLRKKAIKINLYTILMLRKKKSNPVWSIITIVLTSYLPMVFFAILAGKERKKKEAETAAANIAAFHARNTEIATEKEKVSQAAEKVAKMAEDYSGGAKRTKAEERELKKIEKDSEKITSFVDNKTPGVKKKTQGRHKKTCIYYQDKKLCNCK